MRWREAVEETKKLSITSLDQLEVGRDYKTEQGIPIKRLPTNELDLAGKILLKILPQLDGRTGATLLVRTPSACVRVCPSCPCKHIYLRSISAI